jgi:uncharacterized protein YjbI with pentapeptide repeats
MIEIKHKDTGEVLHTVDADSLSGANLRYADLRYANLSGANLSYANLRYANLSYANLSYANLRSAKLRGANLSYANLRSADLRDADLIVADLRYADLSHADLRETIYDTQPEREKKVQALLASSKDCLELLEDWFPTLDDMRCASEEESQKIDRLKSTIEKMEENND